VKKNAEIYSQALLNLEGSKVLANFVMAIASDVNARSIVDYSESAVFHYQYSSISQMFIRIVNGTAANVLRFIKKAEAFVLQWMSKVSDFSVNGVVRTALDCTPVKKPHSDCLKDKQYVYTVNETIKGNKPIEIGYLLSSLNIGFAPKWSVIASLLRVKSDESATGVGIAQLQKLCDSLECKDKLVVNSADSGYGHAAFLAPIHAQKNLVNVVRLKACNVWNQNPRAETGGANGIYGDCYHLRRKDAETKYKTPKTGALAIPKTSIAERKCDQTEIYETTTKRGKVIEITLHLHKSMMIRSKKGHNMKDKPFDLVIVEAKNKATDKAVFGKPIYLAVTGQRKGEISLRAAYEEHYAHRYDIEPNNRFIKQQLLLEKFGTPHAEHFDIWLSILSLAETLLLLTSTELTPTQLTCKKKWQRQNAPTVDTQPIRPTIAQTRKAAQALFLTFDSSPFLPQNSKKGKGRKLGTKFTPKTKYSVVRKAKKDTKKDVKDTKKDVKDTKT
jgi:hypothetical protein